MTELPLLVIDVQRGGPSTGLPTKTEQADLLQAMFGRNGESPVPVVAPATPADCFDTALDAARIALTYRTPVLLLSDGYIANGSEPWLDPGRRRAARLSVEFTTEPNAPGRIRRLLALSARPARPSPGPGRCPAPPDSNTASAASRSRTARATSPTTPTTTTAWSALRAGQDRRNRRPARPGGGRPVRPGRGPGGGLGLDVRADHRRRRRVRRAGHPVAHVHLRHLNPCPPNLGEVLCALPARRRAGDEPRPARACCCAPSTWSTPIALHEGRRPAVRRGRTRSGVSPKRSKEPDMTTIDSACRASAAAWSPRPRRSCRRRTSSPTRRCAGAPAAATTRSWPRSRASCPSSGMRRGEHRVRLGHRLLRPASRTT